MNLISNHVEGEILDAGCRDGRNTECFDNVVGIDIEEESLKKAEEKGLETYRMDLNEELGFEDNRFDTVICAHVLEHLYSPYKALKELKRVTKKDGKLIIAPQHKITAGWWLEQKVSFVLFYMQNSETFSKGVWTKNCSLLLQLSKIQINRRSCKKDSFH